MACLLRLLLPDLWEPGAMTPTPPGDPVRAALEASVALFTQITETCAISLSLGNRIDEVLTKGNQALQAVQPSPLVWTREAPKTAGFYCRTHPSWVTCKSKFDVIEIYDHDIGRMPVKGFLWAGPIPEPEALPKEGAK